MSDQLEYSSTLNGSPFLIYELKQVLQQKINGLNDQEIRKKVVEENLFQLNSAGKKPRSLPAVMRRAKVLDSYLSDLFLNTTIETSKLINLYTIMKTDRLFFEFMDEVIGEKLSHNEDFLESKDVNIFFNDKAEQSEKVASWSEVNIEKLKRVFLTILFASGILIKRNEQLIKPILIDEDIKQHLVAKGEQKYLRALGVVDL